MISSWLYELFNAQLSLEEAKEVVSINDVMLKVQTLALLHILLHVIIKSPK